MSTFFTLIGFAAGIFTTAAFLPQVFHIYRCKSAAQLSWTMLVIFNLGLVLWFVYGIYLNSWPMILANAFTLFLQAFIIGMKIRYARANRKIDLDNSFTSHRSEE